MHVLLIARSLTSPIFICIKSKRIDSNLRTNLIRSHAPSKRRNAGPVQLGLFLWVCLGCCEKWKGPVSGPGIARTVRPILKQQRPMMKAGGMAFLTVMARQASVLWLVFVLVKLNMASQPQNLCVWPDVGTHTTHTNELSLSLSGAAWKVCSLAYLTCLFPFWILYLRMHVYCTH
jgi:hypothetical protein